MRPLSPEDVRRAVRGRWRSQSAQVTLSGVTIDTRTAKPGCLFVAIKGERFDGHSFLAEAAAAGCPTAIVRQDAPISPELAAAFDGGVIGVQDTVAALGRLAAWHRSKTAATVVGVTGSNGKTTVKRMIHQILRSRLRGSCSPKSFNNAIGLPLTLLDVGAGDDYVVCEIGTSAPGEIAALARIAQPDIAVITSVSEAHLAGLGGIERVAAEKASIVGSLRPSGLAVVCADSPPLSAALRAYDGRIVRFGVSDPAQLRLTGYERRGRSQRFEVNSRLWVDLKLPGKHNALNAMAAIAVAQRFGMSQEDAAEALAGFEPVEMRMQWLDAGAVTIINDAYNANPASVSAAADVLGGCDAKRRVMILGDMLDLGPTSQELHRLAGERIAAAGVDLLICVGQLSRHAAASAAAAGAATETFESVAAAAGVAALLGDGDVVLIKASRAVGLEGLIEPIRSAFTDRAQREGAKS